jgi:hypothetical protein
VEFQYKFGKGSYIAFVTAIGSYYLAGYFEETLLKIFFILICVVAALYYLSELQEEIKVFINRYNHTPVSTWVRIDSIEKDNDGGTLNFIVFNVHCAWMRNLPRVGEFVDIGSIVSDQHDLYLGDNLAGLEIKEIHHKYNRTLLEFKIIEYNSNTIKAFFEEIAEELISLENTTVNDSFGKKVAEGNEMSIDHYPVSIRYKSIYEELKPELDSRSEESQ